MTDSDSTAKNFLPEQYKSDSAASINHNYLREQFADCDDILAKIREVVVRGDFTLGCEVDELEREYAELCGASHAVAVGSGTDALLLSLKAAGVTEGTKSLRLPSRSTRRLVQSLLLAGSQSLQMLATITISTLFRSPQKSMKILKQ